MDDYVPGALSALLSKKKSPVSSKKAKNSSSLDEHANSKKQKRAQIEEQLESKPKKKAKKQNADEPTTSLFEKYEAKLPAIPIGKESLEIVERPKTESRKEQRLNRKSKQAPDTEEQLARTVFVGNAPVEASRKKLKQIFAKYGDIEKVWQRSLLHKTEKLTMKMMGTDKKLMENLKCTTFYVRFKEEQAAKKAIELHGYILDNHHLQIKMANKKILDSFKTIFVGNVPFAASEDELISHFTENCGIVESVRIIRDKTTGLGKGFAYVAFEDPACVAQALKLDGSEFEGRNLRISKVFKKKQRAFQPVAGAKKTRNLKKDKKTKEETALNQKISKFVSIKKSPKSENKLPRGLAKKIKKRKNKKNKTKSFMT